MHREDTISAIATATGPGAVGIIRLSGGDAEALLRRCFAGLPERAQSHHLYLGRVVQPSTGEVLDEALAVVMRAPRSFTGETIAEIQCHGGALNLRRVLEATFDAGARPAEPGEFSLRAFLNGRFDLTQAEAIADVLAAESEAALRVAQAQLGGALSVPIGRLRDELLSLLTLVEAALDFAAEEHVYQLDLDETAARIETPLNMIARFLRAHESGRLSLAGVRVVFVGQPNVGKSSLFNAVVGAERAIVTDVPGTTRDVIEETTSIGPHRVHLIDTAGLRVSADQVEQIGVSRTIEQIGLADLVCWIVDATAEAFPEPPAEVIEAAQRDAALCVLNKVDRLHALASPSRRARHQRGEHIEAMTALLPSALARLELVTTSAETGEGIAWLEATLSRVLARLQSRSDEDTPLVTSARHAEALRRAHESLERALAGAQEAMPLEFIASDLRDGTDALAAIVGAIASDEVLNNIFSSFCVGK